MKRQSRQKGECPGGFERTAFHVAFLSSPARMRGKRKIGRFSKTLEIISLNVASQSVPVTRGQGQSPALEAYLAQNLRATSLRVEEDALARADTLNHLCGRPGSFVRHCLPPWPASLLPTAPGAGCLGFSAGNPLPDQSLVPLKSRTGLRPSRASFASLRQLTTR